MIINASAITLNPYSTMFRYPGPILEPEIDDVNETIEIAEKIYDHVKKIIS